jgi:hypothetical protein
MKVIRSFQDYYDGALSIFNEQVPLYIREEMPGNTPKTDAFKETISLNRQIIYVLPKKDPNAPPWTNAPIRQELHPIIVGFCGKVYPVYVHFDPLSTKNKLNTTAAFVSPDEIYSFYEKVEVSQWWNKSETVFEVVKEIVNKPGWNDIFIELATPVFAYGGNKIGFIKNPCLKDLGFQKLWHPYNAAQEIEMFLNNNLCVNNTPVMPVGSDKIIAESKGFDKYSFRNPPTKKRG